MKRSALLLAAILILIPGCGKNANDSGVREELSHIQLTDGEGNPGGKRIYRYDVDGNMTSMTLSDSLGESVIFESYDYDEEGNMTEKDVFTDTEYERHEYTYKNSLLYEEKIYQGEIVKNSDGSEEKVNQKIHTDFYSYNKDKTIDYIEEKNEDAETVKVTRYVYDDKGRLKKEQILNGEGNYLGGIEYTYESGENPVLKEYVGEASNKYYKEEMTYQGDNLIKTVRYAKDGSVSEIITVDYDENNRKSMVKRADGDGEVNAVNIYYYENYLSLIG